MTPLTAPTALVITCLVLVGIFTVVGVGVFARGVARLVHAIRSGAPESGRWGPVGTRLWTAVKVTILHTTFKGRPVVRVAHWFVMVSFVGLLLTLASSFVQIFDPLFVLPVIGHTAWWKWFTEILASLGLVSILALIVTRIVVNARNRKYPRESRFFGSTRWQAWFVEAVIAIVCASVLILHVLQTALVSSGGAHTGTNVTVLVSAIAIVATIKICVSMLWMVVVGMDVAMGVSWHRFLAPLNIMTGINADGSKSLGPLSLPLIDGNPSNDLERAFEEVQEAHEEDAELTYPEHVIGLGTTSDLTWKDRLDVLSCTECGRCQDLCPAWNTEKPLSPKLVMMALRDNAAAAAGALPPGRTGAHTQDVLGALTAARLAQDAGVPTTNSALVPDVVASEALWDCTMCGACVEQCPVDIEHVNHVGNLRRFQVLMESAFPRELQRPMRAMETKGNPYNQMPRKRLEWAKDLDFDFPVIGEDAEDAEDLDYLFWVGCAGAYEESAKKTTAAVAELLHTAGVNFGVLGSAESCTGDPARRVGNEVLFQLLARKAIETLQEAKAQKIVVTCAHCFNTIANEFPQFGAHFEVIHHTQLLNRLLREELLKPVPAPVEEQRKITYHDPCFLGRYNRVFEAPRELLGTLADDLVEMSQNRERAMCCGAGGGRAWMEETRGTRIASSRMDQAQETGASVVATACPFCSQMLSSAPTPVKGPAAAPVGVDHSDGVAADIEIKDVAVLLLEGVRRGQQGSRPHQ